MPSVKISGLTAAASALGTQEFEVNDSGISKKVTGSQIATYVESEISSDPSFTGQVSFADGTAALPSITNTGDTNTGMLFPAADTVALSTAGTERLRISSDGLVGIGGASSGPKLAVTAAANSSSLVLTDATQSTLTIKHEATNLLTYETGGAAVQRWVLNGVERMRIDGSGNVGIGTSSPAVPLDVNGTVRFAAYAINSSLQFTRAEGTLASPTQITAAAILGTQTFYGMDNTLVFREVAQIRAISDGAITSTSSPGYLAFRTTPSGAVATTEAMRITSAGNVSIATSSSPTNLVTTTTEVGAGIAALGYGVFVRSSGEPLYVNRLTDDGILVNLRQAGVSEGTISVSGTTVSYNGGHLSRWAQFPDNSRPELLKGTVMSNLDQMSNWADEENEQLNCVEISTVEGDANVAGLFVAWDSTEDDYNDILLAMTGDMVIRIAAGVTVARGDLLMSAGDGTAKPQADDIIRAKTIAKVTSNHVSHTYADGSYAVPCVVMAC